MSIYEKLMNIQSELKVPKSQFNSFGKYNYRNSEDILEALKPLLLKHKATLIVADELVQMGDRYYIKATATLWDVEKGEGVPAVAYAREEESKKGMDSAQITGSTSSYARKYALNGLFAIDDTKDADTPNTHGEGTAGAKTSAPKAKTTKGSTITKTQALELFQAAENDEDVVREVLNIFAFENSMDVPQAQFKAVKKVIKDTYMTKLQKEVDNTPLPFK